MNSSTVRPCPVRQHHPGIDGVQRSGRAQFHPARSDEADRGNGQRTIYGPYQTYIDYGVVGGNTVTFDAVGRTVGNLVLDAMAGRLVADIAAPQTYVVDARQLRRWGLSESEPACGHHPDAQRKQPLGRTLVGGSGGARDVVLMQAGVIAALLLERRRRHDAESRSRLHLLEAVHLNQSATAGALSSSIAHELNQPLSAIRNNAEAASNSFEVTAPIWN